MKQFLTALSVYALALDSHFEPVNAERSYLGDVVYVVVLGATSPLVRLLSSKVLSFSNYRLAGAPLR